MKLAFVTHCDLFNPKTWPRQAIGNWGSSYWMAKALENQIKSFEYIGALREKHSIFSKLEHRFYKVVFPQKSYHYWAEPSVNRNYAKQIVEQLSTLQPDIIFSPNIPILAYLDYPKPKVLWTDTTCCGFPEVFEDPCIASEKHLKNIDCLALKNADLAVFSSNWAAQTAQQLYDVNPEKLKVVVTGANMECDRTAEDIETILQSKSTSTCHLLFMGVDWYRKGGNIALEVARSLNQLGVDTVLTIVGTRPMINEPLPEFLNIIDFVDKSTEVGRKQINQLFTQAHFLILPSRSDVTPAVIREASSFGVPSLSTNVGGIPTLISEEKNGKVFGINAKIEEYSQYIQTVFRDGERYHQLATSSFEEYQNRLNWKTAGETVYKLMQELIKTRS